MSELVVGPSIEDCRVLTTEDLIEALDGVPPDKLNCPAMAIAALLDALSRCQPRMEDGAGITTDRTDTTDGRIE